MAVQLYKSGDKHTVNGVQCEAANFNINQLPEMLKAGWVKTPQETSDDYPQIEASTEEENAEEETDVEPQEEADKVLDPRRLVAKEAGIEGWDIKRFATLEAELDELKN